MKYFKLGIDFGGEYLRIFNQQELIFKEHSLIAVRKNEDDYILLATGDKAKLLQKNKSENILVFSPITEGKIQSVEYASLLLNHALNKIDLQVPPKTKLFAFISIPSSLSIEEKENYIKVCKMAGFDKIDIVSTPICSLLGTNAFMPEDEVLIADLGASKCDIQIMKNFQIQKNATLGLGGNSIKSAISKMLLENKNFLIDEENVAKTERELASLFESANKFFSIDGINTQNHTSTQVALTSNEFYPIISSLFEEICLIMDTVINEYQPSQNISAILISGGLGKTEGLQEFLTSKFPNTKIVIEFDTDTMLTNAFQKLLI